MPPIKPNIKTDHRFDPLERPEAKTRRDRATKTEQTPSYVMWQDAYGLSPRGVSSGVGRAPWQPVPVFTQVPPHNTGAALAIPGAIVAKDNDAQYQEPLRQDTQRLEGQCSIDSPNNIVGDIQSGGVKKTETGLARLAKSDPIHSPFSISLPNGNLRVTSSGVDDFGNIKHHAVYVSNLSSSIEGTAFADFKPTQFNRTIYAEKLEEYSGILADEGPEGVLPIQVTMDSKNNMAITDGHHRLAAAIPMEEEINVIIDPRVEDSDEAMQNWQGMIVR